MKKLSTFLAERLKERSTRLVVAAGISAILGGVVPVELVAEGLSLLSVGLVASVGVTKDKQA